jgi:FkbM family methyltransferase
MNDRKVIYDIGANCGDNIPYYLLRADVVVAVEANPSLCDKIRSRFARDIAVDRLKVENCVVVDSIGVEAVDFYVHRKLDVLSQADPPSASEAHDFDCVRIEARTVVDILRAHGDPWYLKLDVERWDARLLRALFRADVRPHYVSAECHDLEVLAVLYELGGYRAFKLVEGNSVPELYKNRKLWSENPGNAIRYSFPPQSAGPFGDDIDGAWMSAEELATTLSYAGFGWKDVHATNALHPDHSHRADILAFLDRLVSWPALMRYAANRTLRSIKRRISKRCGLLRG